MTRDEEHSVERPLKHLAAWVTSSLLSILLMTLHLADDIARGIEKVGVQNLTAVPFLVLWLCGTLMLAGRRSGYIIVLLFAVFGIGIPILHMSGRSIARIATSAGGFFFVWTLIVLATTALLSAVLCVHGLWSLRRRAARP